VTLPARSLAVVGADYPNKRRKGPTRRVEIALCRPGEPVELVLEPKNPADPLAVAVYSERAVQLGYLTAERCGFVGKLIREGREVQAIFQARTDYGAMIRVAFDGDVPTLPRGSGRPANLDVDSPGEPPGDPGDDSDFWPDPVYPDE
jgi:hypothetical protein